MGASKIYPLLFLDLETTGHDPLVRIKDRLVPWHEIIDVGAVIADPYTLDAVNQFEAKVSPEHPERCLPDLVNHYPERAERGEWKDARPLASVMEALLDFANENGPVCIPAGQNFFFDWNFLSVAFAWCGIMEDRWIKCLHYTRLDTRSMAVQELLPSGGLYDPSEFSMRNSRLLVRLGIEPEPEVHEAIYGALRALDVYRRLRELKQARK